MSACNRIYTFLQEESVAAYTTKFRWENVLLNHEQGIVTLITQYKPMWLLPGSMLNDKVFSNNTHT